MKRTLVKVLTAAVVLASLTAADGCNSKVDSNRPPQDHVVDPAKARIAQIRITEASGPYTLLVIVRDGKGGVDTIHETVSGGQWRKDVRYTSGLRLEIRVKVNGHPGDIFACQIVDGPDNKDKERSAGGVLCALTTQR
jgi:hypothetical protein